MRFIRQLHESPIYNIFSEGSVSMSKKFVITGGAGFIGSNLAEARSCLARENKGMVITKTFPGLMPVYRSREA